MLQWELDCRVSTGLSDVQILYYPQILQVDSVREWDLNRDLPSCRSYKAILNAYSCYCIPKWEYMKPEVIELEGSDCLWNYLQSSKI